MASRQVYNTPFSFYVTLKMPIYSTVKGFCNFQAPLGPPKDNQKSFKLHNAHSMVTCGYTSKTIIGLSLILLILGNPPKLAPARKYWKNAEILGDLWPGQIVFTIMKLYQYVNKSLIYLWAKFGFGVNFVGLPKINKMSERPMIVFEVTTCDHRMHKCNLKLFWLSLGGPRTQGGLKIAKTLHGLINWHFQGHVKRKPSVAQFF